MSTRPVRGPLPDVPELAERGDDPGPDALEEWTQQRFRGADSASEAERDRIHEEIIRAYLGVARAMSRRFRNRGISPEDLEQVACTALVQVVRGYDVERGHSFLAYAVPSIRGALKRHFRDVGWAVRPPRRVQDLQQQIRGAEEQLQQQLGRSPRIGEVAAHLEADDEEVIEALAARGCFSPTSLDRPAMGDEPDGASLGDCIAAPTGSLAAAEARAVLGPALRELSPRDRRIIDMRFFEGRTQQEIADVIGVTQMQVSRLLSRILRQLRGRVVDEREPASA